jgi:hypothetical protein
LLSEDGGSDEQEAEQSEIFHRQHERARTRESSVLILSMAAKSAKPKTGTASTQRPGTPGRDEPRELSWV